MRVVLLGPPGAGKGTQAKLLAESHKLAHISTGEMLRASVQEGSELGKKVKDVMDAGQLVPDDLIVSIIEQRIQKPDCSAGYILDGFPRTLPQAKALDEMLKRLGSSIDGVVSFELHEQDVLDRLAHRRGAEARTDDNQATQLERLRVYKEQTAPLVEYYSKTGLLRPVNASGSIEEVRKNLLAILSAR